MRFLLVAAFTLYALVSDGGSAQADLVWNYDSNDGAGGNVVSGLLTTTGDPGDELIPNSTFSLLSIDTVVYNAVDLTPSTNWIGSSGPPFTFDADGTIRVTTPGQAEIAASSSILFAFNATLDHYIILGRPPGNSTFSNGLVGGNFFINPTSTTFTISSAIPEPSAFLCVGLVGLGIAAWKMVKPKVRPNRGRYCSVSTQEGHDAK